MRAIVTRWRTDKGDSFAVHVAYNKSTLLAYIIENFCNEETFETRRAFRTFAYHLPVI